MPYNGTDNNDYVDGQGFCCDDGSPEAAQARALALENNFQDPDAYEKLQFYYHPDHLGSSSYITNLDGEVVQHIEYVPFGEVFIEERNSIWNTPYLFNAKEFDEETGLYYYGARYYDPRLSLWMSTDLMQEKYYRYSSYAYCLWNPVILFDPNGLDPDDAIIAIKFSVGLRFGGNIGKVSANFDLGSKNYVWSSDGTDSYTSTGLDVGVGVAYFTQDNRYKQSTEIVPVILNNGTVLNLSQSKEEVTRTGELGIGFRDFIGASFTTEEKFCQIGQSGIVSEKHTTGKVDLIYSRDNLTPKKKFDVPSSSNAHKKGKSKDGSIGASVNCILGVSVDFNYGKLLDKGKDWLKSLFKGTSDD